MFGQSACTITSAALLLGSIIMVENFAVIEVPLDGTQYDARSGRVLAWCPPGGNGLSGQKIELLVIR